MANRIKRNAGIDANALNIGNWSVASKEGMGLSTATGFYNGLNVPENGYAIYSDNISGRTAANDTELISIINRLSDAPVQWYTLYAITYPESSYAPASRDGITPGFDNITDSKLYNASRDLNYYVFDENTNTWLDNSWFNGERIDGHCYDTYDGQPNQHATFQADYDNIKANFPNATHIVIGSHAAERNTATTGTTQRLMEIGLPQVHIDEGGRPEYILVGKVNEPAHQIYVKENVNTAVAHLNLALPLTGRRATTVQEALDWARDNNVLVLNNHVDNAVRDGLKLYLDAGMVASYPKGGTNFYDLSGSNNHHNIVNNPVHNGKDFTLNETQGFNISNAATKATNSTVVLWYKTTDGQELWVRGDTGSEYIAASNGNNYYHQSSGSPTYYGDLSQVTNPNTQGVRDGKYHMVEAKNVNFSAWDSMNWFLYGSSWNMNGSVAKIMVYDRPITSQESSQNYYGGNIVTNGLVFAADPANLVSYEPGSTKTYSLSSGIEGDLVAGVGFKNVNGGVWDFNNNDDYIQLGHQPSMLTPDITQEAWVRSDLMENWHGIISNMNGWGSGFSLQIGPTQNIAAMVSGDYLKTSWKPETGVWYHVLATHRSSDNMNILYVNGKQEASFVRGIGYNANAVTEIGRFYTGSTGINFIGQMGPVRMYNRALSQEEVLQNYNAQVTRFK